MITSWVLTSLSSREPGTDMSGHPTKCKRLTYAVLSLPSSCTCLTLSVYYLSVLHNGSTFIIVTTSLSPSIWRGSSVVGQYQQHPFQKLPLSPTVSQRLTISGTLWSKTKSLQKLSWVFFLGPLQAISWYISSVSVTTGRVRRLPVVPSILALLPPWLKS